MANIPHLATLPPVPDINQLFAEASAHHQAGKFVEAETLYGQILAIDPNHADCHHLLGGLALQTGQFEMAAVMFGKAIALDDQVPEYHYNLAISLWILGRLEDAVAHFQGALTLRPQFIEALCDLGDVLTSLNRLSDATSVYEQAIALNPSMPEVLCKYGDVLQIRGYASQAIVQYERAVLLKPAFVVALSNLGSALYGQGRFGEAILRYEQCIACDPSVPETHCNLGNALYGDGRFSDAVAKYQHALSLQPASPKTLCNLGDALLALGKFKEAALQYEQALAIDPKIPEGWCNLGDALQGQGRLDEAIKLYEQALSIKPDLPEALCNMGSALLNQGRVAEAIDHYRQALVVKPELRTAYSNLLMALHYVGAPTIADISQHAVHCAQLFSAKPPSLGFENIISIQRRICVGYVSGDFGNHPVGYFLQRVLPAHNRSTVEIFCYSNGSADDDLTATLRRSTDHWRDIGGLSDTDTVQMIRRDGIDILIDLSGHTLGNRLNVFAMRAAPVQVTWLGYFGTTGLAAMDYIIADRFVAPLDHSSHYVESIWRMPDSYLCFAPPDVDIPARSPLSPTGTPLIFGCFSNLAKASPESVILWSSVLNRIPHSKLMLKAKGLDEASVRDRLLDQMASYGVASERIIISSASSRKDYLAAYHRIDLMLDTTPFSGGTTTAEALWMGVPVVTLRGPTWAGRICESILSSVGLTELVADTAQQYVEIAVRLTSDVEGLAELRSRLRTQLEASPFCDALRFTGNLEVAYRTMWSNWCSLSTKAPARL